MPESFRGAGQGALWPAWDEKDVLATGARLDRRPPAHDFAPSDTYSVLHLYSFALRPLLSLIQSKAVAPGRAGSSRARKRQAVSHA